MERLINGKSRQCRPRPRRVPRLTASILVWSCRNFLNKHWQCNANLDGWMMLEWPDLRFGMDGTPCSSISVYLYAVNCKINLRIAVIIFHDHFYMDRWTLPLVATGGVTELTVALTVALGAHCPVHARRTAQSVGARSSHSRSTHAKRTRVPRDQ